MKQNFFKKPKTSLEACFWSRDSYIWTNRFKFSGNPCDDQNLMSIVWENPLRYISFNKKSSFNFFSRHFAIFQKTLKVFIIFLKLQHGPTLLKSENCIPFVLLKHIITLKNWNISKRLKEKSWDSLEKLLPVACKKFLLFTEGGTFFQILQKDSFWIGYSDIWNKPATIFCSLLFMAFMIFLPWF